MFNAQLSLPLQPVLPVSELTQQIKDMLESNFINVAVVGEISNFKPNYSSGHWYFSLKDKDATLACACFRGANKAIKFTPEDGLQVVARGQITVYPPRGSYQLVVSSLEPVGIGDWQLAFEQLKEKLAGEGLLELARKRPVPLLPRKIGVVTSLGAAALQDILAALKRRNSNVQVVISPCRVQGEGSAEDIAAAINLVQQVDGIDVVIVARGGGSIEDLWSFNTEGVARAVAQCRVPVISGVGHETDLTICDLVADLRAPTPTAAAELVAKGRVELTVQWMGLTRSLLHTMEVKVSRASLRLQKLEPGRVLSRHAARLAESSNRMSFLRQKLLTGMSLKYIDWYHKWSHSHDKLQVLGPRQVLDRGFSILRNRNDEVIRSAFQVTKGEALQAQLADGALILKVEEVN